jgi:AraC-like DNA-binding protein
VALWDVWRHSKTKVLVHRVPPGLGHGWLVPVGCSVLEGLKVGASIHGGGDWFTLCDHAGPVSFEIAHGRERPRWAYNERECRAAASTRRARIGSHAGFCDLFVPVLSQKEVAATIVVGPFSPGPPSAADILARWRWLTGAQGHPADAEFRSYLKTTLGTLRLDRAGAKSLERLLTCLAQLMAGTGRADLLANEVHRLGTELAVARASDRMWKWTRSMLDERSQHTHYSAARTYDLVQLGLDRAPDQALVGLFVDLEPGGNAVDQAVLRYELQRACTDLARAEGDTIAGQIGDHGVVFLVASKGSTHKRQLKLKALAESASLLGRRRYGCGLSFGASTAPAMSLDRSFQAALSAAELALTRRAKLVVEQAPTTAPGRALRALREEVARVAKERADLLPATFDRYVEVVSIRTGYRMDGARAELEICFQRVADALLGAGVLDQKSFLAMCERLDRSSGDATTVNDLFEAYRTAIHDLARAAEAPVAARQDRGLQGAIDFIQQHYSEPLPLSVVARASGYSRDHFSELFKTQQGVTFERYVFRLRLGRARELLTGTDLSVTRVAELSGFGSPQYLCRVFRRAVGTTPLAYRRRAMPDWARRRAGLGAQRNPLKAKAARSAAR